jgi:hypothetical protein
MYFSQPYLSNFHDAQSRPQPDLSNESTEMHRLLAILQRIPLSSVSFRRAMAAVVNHLRSASRALALGCGMSSELRYLPEVWGLPELQIVHARYLTPLSYHLNSALGAAELLASGRGRPAHFPLMVGCMLSIVRLWQTFPEAIANLRRAAGPRYTAAIDESEHILRQMVPAIQQAVAMSKSVVDPTLWETAVEASRLAYEVREKVAKSLGEEMY